MSDLLDWLEEARIERMMLERRPSSQTGLYEPSVLDEFAEDEPEDEENSDDE